MTPTLPQGLREAVECIAARMSAWAYPVCASEGQVRQRSHFARQVEIEITEAIAPFFPAQPTGDGYVIKKLREAGKLPPIPAELIAATPTVQGDTAEGATPRTDKEASDGWSGDAVCVDADFARTLERELAAVKYDRACLIERRDDEARKAHERRVSLKSELAAVKQERDAALAQAAKWQYEYGELCKVNSEHADKSIELIQANAAHQAWEKQARELVQSIADEANSHHEYNPVGKVARLPKGYGNILNMASDFLSTPPASGGTQT